LSNLESTGFTMPEPLPGKSGWPWTVSPEPLPVTMPDGSHWPKITVVTPSFNQGQFIEETIRSVLLQGYPNLEFIIVDGGSTDNSIEIIKKYEPWLAYWVSEPDRGQSHAVNKGIQKATGDILFWLNSDDLALPGAFHTVADKFHHNPESSIISGQAYIINGDREVIGSLKSYFISWEELATSPRNHIRQISTFFYRLLFEECGYLNEDLHISMDTELIVRLTKNHPPLVIQESLTAFRTHHEAKTASRLIEGYLETDRVRPQILETKELHNRYKFNSAMNWISLAELETQRWRIRKSLLLRALKLYPKVITKHRFWMSIT